MKTCKFKVSKSNHMTIRVKYYVLTGTKELEKRTKLKIEQIKIDQFFGENEPLSCLLRHLNQLTLLNLD